jgi:hypothetical protein
MTTGTDPAALLARLRATVSFIADRELPPLLALSCRKARLDVSVG